MRLDLMCALALAAGLALGCGDDAAASTDMPTDAPTPDGAEDTAPEIRSVVANLEDPLRQSVDVSASAGEVVLGAPTPIEWVVQVRDLQTAAEDLELTLLDGEGVALDAAVTFRSGNWRLAATIAPGQSQRVRVRDRGGNTSETSPIAVPTLNEALAADWEQLRFDLEQSITARTRWTFGGMNFERTPDGEEGSAGSFVFEDEGRLTLMSADFDFSGEVTVEEPFFALGPWRRATPAATPLAGSYRRAYAQQAVEIVETLAFGDDGAFTYAREEDGAPTLTQAGSFRLVLAENYETSLGDFLERTVTEENGDAVPPRSTLDLFISRSETLLIGPVLRIRGGE